MARKLPWLVNSDQKAKSKRAASSKPQGPAKKDKENGSPPSTSRRNDPTRGREPSSSPPPSPPTQELMREGYDADDIYIMVEDEFEAVARSFTAHLRHAAYHKVEALQREAQNHRHQRPINPRVSMSKPRQKAKEAEANRRAQSAALRQAGVDRNGDGEGEREDLWVGTSLHGLMESPRKTRVTLEAKSREHTQTTSSSVQNSMERRRKDVTKKLLFSGREQRSSAHKGTHDARQDITEEEDDDDDLDGPSPPSSMLPPSTHDTFSTSSFNPPSGASKFEYSLTGSSLSSATPSRYLMSSQRSSAPEVAEAPRSRPLNIHNIPDSQASHLKSREQDSTVIKTVIKRMASNDSELDFVQPTELPHKSRVKKRQKSAKEASVIGAREKEKRGIDSLDDIPIFLA